ncbi:MAG: hypothetical protein PWR13_682 [Archaeoglobi archaeon]|nr:hypothetical protein [Candidatus Mnemosynella bozhongmuii]MDK2781654.1 hypothetical protein [Archaeoglobi archaeon]
MDYEELRRWVEDEIAFCERQIEMYQKRLEMARKIKKELERSGKVISEKRADSGSPKISPVSRRRGYRDVMSEIKNIVASLGAKFQAVPRDEIVRIAVERGIPEREVNHALRCLISEGKLFEPREKMIRMIH